MSGSIVSADGANSSQAKPRAGKMLLVVGLSLFGVSFLSGVVFFFVPIRLEGLAVAILTVLLPGFLGVVGFVLAVVGLVLVLVAPTRRAAT